jgi:hypothetical protein
MREEMLKAAEPIINDVIADLQTHLRQRVAAMVTGLITSEYDVMRDGMNLRITVKLAPPTK